MEKEIPLQNFIYCPSNILEKLYQECEIEAKPYDTEAFLALEPTEAYKNNKERIAREEREKMERERAMQEAVDVATEVAAIEKNYLDDISNN
jgi:hypothetical protein